MQEKLCKLIHFLSDTAKRGTNRIHFQMDGSFILVYLCMSQLKAT